MRVGRRASFACGSSWVGFGSLEHISGGPENILRAHTVTDSARLPLQRLYAQFASTRVMASFSACVTHRLYAAFT